MAIFQRRARAWAKLPDSWTYRCEGNFEILLVLFTGLILFLTLMRFITKDGPGIEEASALLSSHGIAFGALGSIGVPIAERIAQRLHGHRSQLRSLFVVLASNIFLNAYISTIPEREVQHFGLLGLSLMTKFSVPVLGWSMRFSAALVCGSCGTFCLTLIAFTEGALRSELILMDCFFILAAGIIYLTYISSLQDIFDSLGMLEFDNAVLMRVMRLSCDGELCISFSSESEAWIDKADLQLMDLVGSDVEGESLKTIMYNDSEYQRIVEEFDGNAGPTLRTSTFRDQHGQAIPVELFAVELHHYPYPPGSPARAQGQGYVRLTGQNPVAYYLVGVRLVSDGSTSSPSPRFVQSGQRPSRSTSSPEVRQSPAESMSSVLPNVVGRSRRDNPSNDSNNSRGDPSPVVSSSEKDKGSQTNSSLLFQKGKLDMSCIVDLGVKEHWFIDTSELELQPYSVLGRGGFGIVVECQYYGAQLAAKITNRSQPKFSLADMTSCEGFFHELRMLRHMRHPNIVQFYGACIEPQGREIVLVFEKIDALTLGKFLQELSRSSDTKPLSSHKDRVKVMLDLARALDYMHARKPAMTHGDLKPANVFVRPNGPTAILSDFGLAKQISSQARAGGFTTRWGAPEIVLGLSGVTTHADVFSYGRLMSFIITEQVPLQELDEDDIVKFMRFNNALPMPDWPENILADVCASLSESCLEMDPESRPAMPVVRKLLEKAPDLLASGLPGAGSNQATALLALLPATGNVNLPGHAMETLRVESDHSRSSRDNFLRLLELVRESDQSHLR